MRKGLENALDQCLIRLAQGEDLEACLQRFPQQRDELEPLLRMAAAVRAARQPAQPSPQALARARVRFMAEAVVRREASDARQRASFLTAWLRPMLSRGVATAALTLVLLLAILGGGSIASANSLPGDPLYGVKRVSENVRLFLTLGAERRAELQQEYEAERVVEVKQVLGRNRQVDVVFAGVVDSVEGNRIVVGGIAVELPPDMAIGERLAVGAQVQITARVQADGVVEAKALAPRAQPKAVAAETPMVISTSPVEKQPSSTPTVLAKPSATTRPSDTPKPSITATATSLPTETTTATISATGTLTHTATSTVEPTGSSTLTPTRTATPKPTNTPVPPPRDVQVRIEGQIDEISSNHWVVSGQRITVRPSTRINQDRARAQVGGWAIVKAVKKPSGELQASEITIVRGVDQPPVPREFSGAIESIGADRWVVGGQQVLIAPDTQIEGTPVVGATARVQADQYADGRLVARHITVDSLQVVQFEGVIQTIQSDRWVVAGQEVLIGSETSIEGDPVVGALAEVEAVVRADGSKLARRIRVRAMPTAEPTDAPTATIAPPTVTPGPQATPTSAEPTATDVPAVATPIAPTPRP